MPTAPSSRRARGDRTKAALVAAALELFGRHGVDATSVDEITAAAHVAKGTFYVHFERKTDVLLERAAALLGALAGAAPPTDTPPDVTRGALQAMGRRLAAEMGTTPRPVMGRMVREIVGKREDWLRVLGDRPTLSALILPVVATGQRDGALRSDLSARRLAQALTILWLDAVVGWAERPRDLDLGVDIDRATTVFLDGAAAR